MVRSNRENWANKCSSLAYGKETTENKHNKKKQSRQMYLMLAQMAKQNEYRVGFNLRQKKNDPHASAVQKSIQVSNKNSNVKFAEIRSHRIDGPRDSGLWRRRNWLNSRVICLPKSLREKWATIPSSTVAICTGCFFRVQLQQSNRWKCSHCDEHRQRNKSHESYSKWTPCTPTGHKGTLLCIWQGCCAENRVNQVKEADRIKKK